ncbi:PREDICTED: glucose dehydrogenase [FAD, quinone]-like [Papilio xuthus]|uniref:Glucose dehydrogenase [FAD, quinone]-like n=1 Tax=Papilio xuthus TaxID=66420 RepID=A0AAJ6Z8T8_PAPXU|nr:PREDICTED: glucose dehydrogenase [FAD, quinone]-like [Papilio xuthus]
MFFKLFIVLSIVSRTHLTSSDEVIVETVDGDEENNVENIYNENIAPVEVVRTVTRNNYENPINYKNIYGRQERSQYNNPFMELIANVIGTQSGYKESDFFAFLRDEYPLPRGLQSPLPEYDFVIVGAGSAGCALASRLTENRNVTVLLIETGKPEMLLTDVPAIAPYFQSTPYVWHYYMEPQPGVCLGMENGRCFWPRGNAVGGSSVINYMIYTRGRPEEWDRIAAAGNYGWSYNEVLEYYKKSEKAKLDGFEKKPYRNRDGVLPVEFVPIKTKLIKAFLDAGRILGHPTVDYNAPEKMGFGKVQVTMSMGRRFSSAKAFLHNHKKRPNLHILPETRATKVLIDPQTKTAYGVEYVRNNVLHRVTVRKEVILSAGPIASPQLLMLSGLGPRDHLNSVGINVIQDLPVGKRLYDHICFPGLIFTVNETNISFLESQASDIHAIVQWLKNGDSAISSPGGVEGIGYIKTPVSDDPELVPDIELISIGGSIVSDGGPGGSKAVRKGMRITDNIFNNAFGPIDQTNTWSAFPMLLKPKSFGSIELKDNNPFSHPKMYGNYLTDPRDVATFVAAIRHIQELTETEPFQKYGTKLYPAIYPTCSSLQFNSDEYWECAVRTLTATLHHQVATTRMGPQTDPLAVVDPELRVHGIKRLRVVDTGIIPEPISAHTNAPGIMIGEKAADMIKLTWSI